MPVTPHDQAPYYPMILANGSDAVLINYTGSMASGLTGHAHLEQHQGTLCGWYKPAHAGYLEVPYRQLSLLVESGYQVILDGEVCDIQDYRQQFDPRRAVLTTQANARGVWVEIESFLLEAQVLVERYRVMAVPPDRQVDFALYVRGHPAVMGGLWGINQTQVTTRPVDRSRIDLTYQVGPITGGGFMMLDRPAEEAYEDFPGLRFHGVGVGFSVTKMLGLIDQTDTPAWQDVLADRLTACQTRGAGELQRRHEAAWQAYAEPHRVQVPDERLQYLYDYSLYYLRANQYPATGAISCGPLPHQWAGGVHVPYDAFFAHEALLRTNHLDEARAHLGFHRANHARARELAQEAGVPGAIFSGWSDARGEHLGRGAGRNWQDYLLKYKPLMPAYLVLDAFRQWRMDPADPSHAQNLPYMKDILDLAIERFVVQAGDRATMAPCIAGNESAVVVQNDTLNGLVYAVALIGYGRMSQALEVSSGEPYGALGHKLLAGIEQNRRAGVLLPYEGATYLTGLQLDFYLTMLPERTDARSVTAALEAIATDWGLDSDQPSEAYRDWPWFNSRAAIALAHLQQPEQAFHWLRQSARHASGLGALPEKIRLDGFVIGYGYVTAHALYVWSLVHALAHDGPEGEIALLYGLDGSWTELAAENIRLEDGLLLSLTVSGGRLTSLRLSNPTGVSVQRQLVIHPVYGGVRDSTVVLLPHQTLECVG